MLVIVLWAGRHSLFLVLVIGRSLCVGLVSMDIYGQVIYTVPTIGVNLHVLNHYLVFWIHSRYV